MAVIPDNLILASELPTFINPITTAGTISINGTIANNATTNFSATLSTTISPNLFRSDIYGLNSITNTKILLNTLLVMERALNGYSYKSTEFVTMNIKYSSSTVTITYSIFNGTGASVTLIPQTIALTLAEYQVPF